MVAVRTLPTGSVSETVAFLSPVRPSEAKTRPEIVIFELVAAPAAPPQKPPLSRKPPPAEVVPAVDSPDVPSSVNVPPDPLPPPPAITDFLMTNDPPDCDQVLMVKIKINAHDKLLILFFLIFLPPLISRDQLVNDQHKVGLIAAVMFRARDEGYDMDC